MTRRLSRRVSLAWVAASLLLAGCLEPDVPDPANQVEAATAHVAVTTVAPWSRYIDALQPAFSLTPDQALTAAVPTTAAYRRGLVDAFRLNAQVGLPSSTSTATTKSVTDAAGAVTKTGESTTSEGPGALPDAVWQQAFPRAGTLPFLERELQTDPILQYNAAAALYQEVQILGRELTDAATRFGYTPYFVRLKLTSLPNRRDLDYDLFSDLFFFNDASAQGSDHCADNAPDTEKTNSVASVRGDNLVALVTKESGPDQQTKCELVYGLPYVVPLLVSDNLEAAEDAATARVLRDLALSLGGTVQNIAFQTSMRSVIDRLNQSLARDANALQTVARLGDNALRVRIGARFAAGQKGKRYELIPQNHTVSLLILVPNEVANRESGPRRVEVVVQNRLKRTDTGAFLAPAPRNLFKDGLGWIDDELKLSKQLDSRAPQGKECQDKDKRMLLEVEADVAGWLGSRREDAVYGRWVEFLQATRPLETCGILSDGDVRDLWVELVKLSGDFAVAAASFDVPLQPPPSAVAADQVVTLEDDGSATQVRIVGGDPLREYAKRAFLRIRPEPEKILATDADVQGGMLVVTFPPLSKLGLKNYPDSGRLITAELNIPCDPAESQLPNRCPNRRTLVTFNRIYRVAQESNEKPEPEVKLQVSATYVIADEAGRGSLAVGVTYDNSGGALERDQRLVLRVSGAEVRSVAGASQDALGRPVIGATGLVSLTLGNLVDGGLVSIVPQIVTDKTDLRELPGGVSVVIRASVAAASAS